MANFATVSPNGHLHGAHLTSVRNPFDSVVLTTAFVVQEKKSPGVPVSEWANNFWVLLQKRVMWQICAFGFITTMFRNISSTARMPMSTTWASIEPLNDLLTSILGNSMFSGPIRTKCAGTWRVSHIISFECKLFALTWLWMLPPQRHEMQEIKKKGGKSKLAPITPMYPATKCYRIAGGNGKLDPDTGNCPSTKAKKGEMHSGESVQRSQSVVRIHQMFVIIGHHPHAGWRSVARLQVGALPVIGRTSVRPPVPERG
ncbi:hypothetical protein H257_09535 [Aphanomyces astaci]|uniref:Uncharacterized protein n=1 Tax=Aphanomyces astaci TaxID=112090 RepID=W4GC54_APHAT|nr:hypothetical protein H257_09535 [Aphanomyces astaci]ETV76533.1 hypothetical protein H257_09535 [Aphanomyces astaci]|eukprot:XP_009834078.1 hypothetical protein H257_09535 [Aphanomyces astaci]